MIDVDVTALPDDELEELNASVWNEKEARAQLKSAQYKLRNAVKTARHHMTRDEMITLLDETIKEAEQK